MKMFFFTKQFVYCVRLLSNVQMYAYSNVWTLYTWFVQRFKAFDLLAED